MKTFVQWYREKYFYEIPNGKFGAGWPFNQGFPAIVACSNCCMTMPLPNALLDDEGNVYCSSCAE